MNLLGRLIAREVLKNIAYVLLVLTSIFVLFDTILGASRGEYVGLGFEVVVSKALLRSPRALYDLLPLSSLTGCLLTFARLSINSEFAVMRTSGLSYKKISKVLTFTALVVMAFAIFVGEVVKPRASSALTAFSLSNEAGELVVQTFQSGSWFKDQNKIINARYISDNYDVRGVVVYQIDPDNRALEMIISSEQGRLSEVGVWSLDDVSVVAFDNDRVIKSKLERFDIKTSITHGVVNLIATDQESLSFLDLSKYINHLEANGEDTYSYRSTQWQRVGHLAIILTLILIGPLFVSSNSRGRQPSFWVFNGVLVGVGLYFFTQLSMAVGTLGRIAPPVYMLMPPALILFSAALYIKLKGE